MDPLKDNIAAYGHMQKHLEMQHQGDWAVVHERKLAGIYSSYEEALKKAVGNFGHGPDLIAEVGGEWICRRVKEVQHEAAMWLAAAGGSDPDAQYIPRRRSELVE